MTYNTLYLLIGGNQGDRAALLQQATDLIQLHIGSVAHFSSIYETQPWGTFAPGEKPQNFYNQALEIHTLLSPLQVLEQSQAIEKKLGRQRLGASGIEVPDDVLKQQGKLYASRPIDIDLIFYNDEIINNPPDLILPHPRAHLRAFVLKPLCDIAADFIHPLFQCSLNQLLLQCPDSLPCLPLC